MLKILVYLPLMVLCVAIASTAEAQECTLHAQAIADVPITHWRGTCTKGIAQGDGAILFYTYEGSAAGTFYGKVKDGTPYLGAYELTGVLEGGYKVIASGRDTENAQTTLDAFRVAAAAARSLSKRFAAEGNKASVNYYEKAAKALDAQIE